MNKSMYSLILSDNVVAAVDELAREQVTNRSALVNKVLAEYVSYVTPEQRISTTLNSLQSLLTNMFDVLDSVKARSLSARTELAVKYRPSLVYEVELYGGNRVGGGEIRITTRSQSANIIQGVRCFTEYWSAIEQDFRRRYSNVGDVVYYFEGSRIRRVFTLPENVTDDTALGKAIYDYIVLFDNCVKRYVVEGERVLGDVASAYGNYANAKGAIIL